MEQNKFDKEFWNGLYISEDTGWDIGYPSTPIKTYIDQLESKDLKILIPGAGNAHEAEYLWKNGFKNTFIVDIAPEAIKRFQQRVPDFPKDQTINTDFFDLDDSFDIIFEQTFFCALPRSFRKNYCTKMHSLLKENRKLVGLLFSVPRNDDHPPFGGNEKEYRNLFKSKFEIEIMEECYNSIPPRAGSELFISLLKK